jgi:hypothetical protein
VANRHVPGPWDLRDFQDGQEQHDLHLSGFFRCTSRIDTSPGPSGFPLDRNDLKRPRCLGSQPLIDSKLTRRPGAADLDWLDQFEE